MSDIILHHYDLSPYAAKIRVIMGFKGLAWKSVQIPMVMPKPDLTCLTGGYRKTPVLQIGADVYCDTKTIARALERVKPQPTLYPPNTQATESAMSTTADAMFLMVVGAALSAGLFPKEFIDDRKKMFPGGFDVEQMKRLIPAKLDQLRVALTSLDEQLADGRHFLLGDKISLADFSIYNPVSVMPMTPLTAALLAPLKHLSAWSGRMAGIGEGTRTEITSDEAIAIARDAKPATPTSVAAGEPNGYKPGDRLSVMPEDYGRDPVVGELVYADAYEIALRRTDARVGEVVVHFPRQGYLTFRG